MEKFYIPVGFWIPKGKSEPTEPKACRCDIPNFKTFLFFPLKDQNYFKYRFQGGEGVTTFTQIYIYRIYYTIQ